MKKILNLILFVVILSSLNCCKKENKTFKTENVRKDKLLSDSLYNREWLKFGHEEERLEDIEIYISEKGDTIYNQYKVYKENKVDTLNSEFYDLKLYKTDKPNIYRGQITLHSLLDTLKLNQQNSRIIEFLYCEQNKDSIRTTSIKSDKLNTIEFEYENFYSNQLQGVITATVWIDPKKKDKSPEDILTHYRIELLVDSYIKTDNFILEAFEFDKERKFNEFYN